MEFIFLKLCFSMCLLLSSKGLEELFVDSAILCEPNFHGQMRYDVFRQANGDPRVDCITESPNPAPNRPNAPGSSGAPNGNGGSPNASGNSVGRIDNGNANGGSVNSGQGGGSNDATGGTSDSFFSPNMKTPTTSKLQALVQHIYAAQARVQLEATEIRKAQGVATAAQRSLEEASNNVRVITAALQTAQQEVAAAAVRAQTAQLQLAAHDQLLFAARQKVDALSAQMVGLQAEDGIVLPQTVFNIQRLLNQLRQPLPMSQTPTPIPTIDNPPNGDDSRNGGSRSRDSRDAESKGTMDDEDDYMGV